MDKQHVLDMGEYFFFRHEVVPYLISPSQGIHRVFLGSLKIFLGSLKIFLGSLKIFLESLMFSQPSRSHGILSEHEE